MLAENGTTSGETARWEALPGTSRHPRSSDIEGWLTAARPRLHRLARLRGVVADAIEDVVQETLLEAWKHLDRFHMPDGFHAWLDEICRNICRRHVRKRSMDRRCMSPLLAYDDGARGETEASLVHDVPDLNLLDPLEALSREDMTLLLDRAFDSLSPSARELVELCYLLEKPQREVAVRLGLSISALEARLHRARRQLRQVLNGPLRGDAEALGLALDEESAAGWRETRLWCTLCGRRRLMGLFLPQPNGSTNMHVRCPACERHYGLDDVHCSNVHSRGLVQLAGVRSFRPAWKRTMQGVTRRFTQALLSPEHPCPHCGAPASLRLMDKLQGVENAEGTSLPAGMTRHPYQFWVSWRCPQCHRGSAANIGVFAASDLVYWSDARTRHFMAEHPRWVSEQELLVDYAGQPALRLQMADVTGAARLTVLAHRQTLRVLAVF